MSYKIDWAQDSEVREAVEKLPVGKALTDFGTFNRLPEPFFEVTEHEFYHSRGMATPQWISHYQVRDASQCERMGYRSNEMVGVQIEWFSDRGYGIIWPRKWECADREKDGFFIRYTERPRYFRFGCKHEASSSKVIGRCLSRITCHDCGYVHDVDSSD